MIAIHEIQQVLIVKTELGDAHALFIIDYGIHSNTIWICSLLKNGEIKHFDSNQIKLIPNHTLEFNINK